MTTVRLGMTALLMSESDCAKARQIRMRNVFTQWLKVFTLCLIKQNSIFSNSSDLLVIALRTDIVNVLTGITGWGWNLGFVSAHLSSFLDQRMQKTDHYFFSANSPLVVIKRIKSTKGINTKKYQDSQGFILIKSLIKSESYFFLYHTAVFLAQDNNFSVFEADFCFLCVWNALWTRLQRSVVKDRLLPLGNYF